MRSLHITGTCNPEAGGPARSSQGLVSGLEQLGQETLLLSCTPGDKPFFKGVKRFACAERRGIRACREMVRRMIFEFAPDFVYCSGMWDPYVHVAVQEAFRVKIPCVVAPRGCFSPWAMQHKRWKKILAWWIYMRRDLGKVRAFHSTSTEETGDIRALGFHQPVLQIPNGVEMPDLDIIRQAVTLRNRLGMNAKRVRRILFLSRIHFQKGLRELIEAWSRIADRSESETRWQLEVRGTDADGQEKDFIRLAESLGLKVGRRLDEDLDICFPGSVSDDEKWFVYAQADAFVLPSYGENFGISIAEALYAGIPCIASRRTPWQELETENCGLWVDGDVVSLESALLRMIARSDNERVEMGIRGRRLIERKYTWSAAATAMVRAYANLFEPILEQHKSGFPHET